MRAWHFAVAAWICLIFFSSTSLASVWCESGFSSVSSWLFKDLHPHSSAYNFVHLLADKGLHVSLFCVLAILLWQALPDVQHKLTTILICGALVGCCSEFLQRFFPGRDPAMRDVLINIGGTGLGIFLRIKASTGMNRFADRESESELASTRFPS